jgi:hypothetical protein
LGNAPGDFRRGQIRFRERATQVVDFKDLRYDLITPTDIDGLIEFQNRCYVLIELKHAGNPSMPYGQRLAFERLANDLRKPVVILLCVHDTSADEDIDAAAARVQSVFWRGKWTVMRQEYTAKDMVRLFLERHGGLPPA